MYAIRSYYGKAETDYHLTNYNDALIGFKQFQMMSGAGNTKEFQNLDYNIAYTYFKLKNYSEATKYFQNFISRGKQDKLRLNDAYLSRITSYNVCYTKLLREF